MGADGEEFLGTCGGRPCALEVRHDGVALRPAGAGGGVLYQWSHIKSWTPEDRAMVLEVREGLHQDFQLLEVRLDDPQAVVQALNAAVRAALQRHKVSGRAGAVSLV